MATLYQAEIGQLFAAAKGQSDPRVWQGVFLVIRAHPAAALQFLHLFINSFVNTPLDAELRGQFRALLQEARASKGEEGWETYLRHHYFAKGLRALLLDQYGI